jgi:hypothetical protein
MLHLVFCGHRFHLVSCQRYEGHGWHDEASNGFHGNDAKSYDDDDDRNREDAAQDDRLLHDDARALETTAAPRLPRSRRGTQ